MKSKLHFFFRVFLLIVCFLSFAIFGACGLFQGAQGKPGNSGKDGVGIQNATVDENGDLIITLTDGSVINAGNVSNQSDESENDLDNFKFLLAEDGLSYTLCYIADNIGEEVIIPSTYKGLPVTEINHYTGKGCIFANPIWVKKIVIPDSVTSIGERAFTSCSSLTTVTFEKNSKLTSIGDYAFFDCSNLTTVTFGENSQLTSIGYGVFRGCSSLESIAIPDSVTSIGDYAFFLCSSLKYNEYDNGYYLGNETNPCVALIKAKSTSITSCSINEKTKVIYTYAFFGRSSLESIVIPESVTSIGDYAFEDCSSLTNIVIPDGVTSIGDYAFTGCSSLTNIVIPDGVTSIGYGVFFGCSSLESIVIPSSVTSIGSYAFSGCTALTSVTIPSGVTSIGSYVFINCHALTSVIFEDTTTWYRTSDSSLVGGEIISVIDPKQNASYLKGSLYWYKK